LPQAGHVLLYRAPRLPGLRIDSGIREGDTVSVHYDPLLAKVIAFAETRALATAKLVAALRDFPILGIRTNIPFLIRVLESDAFRGGQVHTGYLDAEGADLASAPASETPPGFVRAVLDAADAERLSDRSVEGSGAGPDPWVRARGWTVR
jgi:3-methylcrotonyl-CoA carboxylase alpha subunit